MLREADSSSLGCASVSKAATEEGGPRETPAALKTLRQDLLGCDNQTRAFLAGV